MQRTSNIKAKTANSAGEAPVGPMHSEAGAPRKDGKMEKRQISLEANENWRGRGRGHIGCWEKTAGWFEWSQVAREERTLAMGSYWAPMLKVFMIQKRSNP